MMAAARRAIVLQETIANAAASRAQALLHTTVALLVGFAVVWFSITDTSRIVDSWQEQEAAGRSTFVVSSTTTDGVKAEQCDAINSISGVIGAGGLITRTKLELPQTPVATVDVIRVTPGYPAAAWPVAPQLELSVIAPNEVAALYGLVEGAPLVHREPNQFAAGEWASTTVDWVPETRSRVDGINDALVFVTSPTGLVQTCLISVEPSARVAAEIAIAGKFGTGYKVEKFWTLPREADDPDQQIGGRPSIWAGTVGIVALLLLRVSAWFARRAEFALYAVLGLRDRDILLMAVWEFTLFTLAPFQLGALIAGFFAIGSSNYVIGVMALDLLRASVALWLIPVAGIVLLRRVSAVALLKGY